MDEDTSEWLSAIENEPTWVKVLFLLFSFFIIISEYLPFTNRTHGNGFAHQAMIVYKNSLRNVSNKSEEKNED